MKAYKISPADHLGDETDRRVQSCISDIALAVTNSLVRGGDRFHYAIDWRDPGSDPDVAYWSDHIGEPHIIALGSREKLQERVRRGVDPFNLSGSDIRSIATCPTATFGYEGEVYLCLRDDDPPPPAPQNPELVIVEALAGPFGQSQYLDGWLPGDEMPKVPGLK